MQESCWLHWSFPVATVSKEIKALIFKTCFNLKMALCFCDMRIHGWYLLSLWNSALLLSGWSGLQKIHTHMLHKSPRVEKENVLCSISWKSTKFYFFFLASTFELKGKWFVIWMFHLMMCKLSASRYKGLICAWADGSVQTLDMLAQLSNRSRICTLLIGHYVKQYINICTL